MPEELVTAVIVSCDTVALKLPRVVPELIVNVTILLYAGAPVLVRSVADTVDWP
jgi:hypothetical protein